MLDGLITKAKELAKEFIASEQDIFAMTTEIAGEAVVVTLKFAVKDRPPTNDDIFRMILDKR